MALYEDQQSASDKFFDWLENDKSLVAGLWASGGFGKSHMCKHLIILMQQLGINLAVTSMTHQAVEVLSGLTGLEVRTLHSTMGWIPKYDTKTGEEYLKVPSETKCPLIKSGVSFLLVDEAGLMATEQVALLTARAKVAGVRLLFVGDHKQCFPVERTKVANHIPAYDATDCYLDLSTPKRVDEHDMIYKLCTSYRRTVDGARQPNLFTILNTDGSGKGVRVVDDIEEAAYKAFNKAIEMKEDVRKIKVLAFTNKRVISLNKKIRKNVFGIKDNRPYVGEEVQANTTISDSLGEEILIRNNQLLTVTSIEDDTQFGIVGWWLGLNDAINDSPVSEPVFVASRWEQVDAKRKALVAQAGKHKKAGQANQARDCWLQYFKLKEFFADIRNTYAVTINKCQGSTLKHALIDMDNIGTCRSSEQAARMAYTGVSRATCYVTIEGELEVKDWRKRA